MDKPKSWVKIQVKLQLYDIINPTFGFVHILIKFGLKQPSIVWSVGAL